MPRSDCDFQLGDKGCSVRLGISVNVTKPTSYLKATAGCGSVLGNEKREASVADHVDQMRAAHGRQLGSKRASTKGRLGFDCTLSVTSVSARRSSCID